MTFVKQVRFEDENERSSSNEYDSTYTDEDSNMYEDETETLDSEDDDEDEFTDIIKYDESVTDEYMESYPENCYHILYVIPQGFNPLSNDNNNNHGSLTQELSDQMEDIMHEHMLIEGLFKKLHSRQVIIPHFVNMSNSDPYYWLSRVPNTYIPHRYDHICLMYSDRYCESGQPKGFINWHIQLITNRFYKMRERHSIYKF